jgi:hypothetical protein
MLENQKICPLCGQPNGCQHDISEATGVKCWCSDLKISPAVFEKIPAEKRGQACVCRKCIEKYA